MSIEPADLQLFKYYRSCRFFYGNKAGRARKGNAPGVSGENAGHQKAAGGSGQDYGTGGR